jgi:hypothetical protein
MKPAFISCLWRMTVSRGQTPILRVPLTRDHLSAISGITFDRRLFLQVRPASYDAAAIVGLLRVLLRKISGKLVVVWDGSPIHRRHEIKDFRQQRGGQTFTSGTPAGLRTRPEPR